MQKLQDVSVLSVLKIILIFQHHIQIYVTCIFNRIRKVTHMTRDIHDIILHPSDSVLAELLARAKRARAEHHD